MKVIKLANNLGLIGALSTELSVCLYNDHL